MLWVLLLSVFFAIAVLFYSVEYRSTKEDNVKEYTRKKREYSWIAFLFFLLLTLFFTFFKSGKIVLVMCAVIFISQILFALFIFKIKRYIE